VTDPAPEAGIPARTADRGGAQPSEAPAGGGGLKRVITEGEWPGVAVLQRSEAAEGDGPTSQPPARSGEGKPLYSRSPTASRASSAVRNPRWLVILPSRTVITHASGASVTAPLPLPRTAQPPMTTTWSPTVRT
jgi:hypothetical protein